MARNCCGIVIVVVMTIRIMRSMITQITRLRCTSEYVSYYRARLEDFHKKESMKERIKEEQRR